MADADKFAGCCYDRQPSGTDLFALAEHRNGRIVSFVVQPEPAVSIAQAKSAALALLPSDTRVLADTVKDRCEQVWYASPALDKAVGHNGLVLVEFEPPLLGAFDPKNINGITFNLPIFDQPETDIPC